MMTRTRTLLLAAGAVTVAGLALLWTSVDVNPAQPDPVVVDTPHVDSDDVAEDHGHDSQPTGTVVAKAPASTDTMSYANGEDVETATIDIDPNEEQGEPDDGDSENAPDVEVEDSDQSLTPKERADRQARAVHILNGAISRVDRRLRKALDSGDVDAAHRARVRLQRLRNVRGKRLAHARPKR